MCICANVYSIYIYVYIYICLHINMYVSIYTYIYKYMLYSYMMTIMENTQFPGLALCGGHSKILARAPWHVLVDL